MSSTLYDRVRTAKMEQHEGEISVKKNMKTETVDPSPMMKERAFQILWPVRPVGRPDMNDKHS